MLAGKRIVVDCRWLGVRAGVGRATELILASLQDDPPPAELVLWGPANRLGPLRHDNALVEPSRTDPRQWLGQRASLSVPAGDVTLYLHQIRPLRPGPSVTAIHDTIPLRHGGGKAIRLAKRAFLLAVARVSTEVLTPSEFAKAAVSRDLGVSPSRIAVMRYPADTARAARVARLRSSLGQEDWLLYVGRFTAHKNVERLCDAYARSDFARRGGRLLLVGGWNNEVTSLVQYIAARGIQGADVRGPCSEEELDELIARSRALILPSLEEGYGLPAFEAVASGLPVAASRTGALTELPLSRATFFEPLDVDGMRAAIDDATARSATGPVEVGETDLRDVVVGALARAAARSVAARLREPS